MTTKITISCMLRSFGVGAVRVRPPQIASVRPQARPFTAFAGWLWRNAPSAQAPNPAPQTQTQTQTQTQPPPSPSSAPLAHVPTAAGKLDTTRSAKHVSVSIDGEPRTFDTAFLRDSCACPQCVDPHSRQKLFQTSDIPEHIEGSCRTVEDNRGGWMVEVEWKNDVPGYGPEHRTRHSVDWLRRALNTELELRACMRYDEHVLWDREKITACNKWVDYRDWMASDEELHDALSHLNRYGLLFLKNVPESEQSVVDIAGRIGTLKDTFYGRTWNVRSKPKAENIAYTPQFLGLHMDLLYTANPPHLQFLHSLRARCPGGESFFSDSFHAAHRLHASSTDHFQTLCDFPVTYHYHHPTHHYHFTRPTIELFPQSTYLDPATLAIDRINWSPPFQGPFEARIGPGIQPTLRDYIAAANAFEKLISAKESLFEYRLNEGECVIFDNRRVLHARRAFDASKGERWLKGAYVDNDVFFSKLRVLDERYTGTWIAEGVVRPAVDSGYVGTLRPAS